MLIRSSEGQKLQRRDLMDRRVSGLELEVSSPPELEVELQRSILQAGNRGR